MHFQFFSRISVWNSSALAVALFFFGAQAPQSFATDVPYELQGVGITEHLGATVPVGDLTFRDESGANVALSKFFNSHKPVVLVMAYYECPNLCTFVLNGLTESLKGMEWLPGKQFEVVTVSINPKETPALAQAKKTAYLKSLGKDVSAGWHFLTGEAEQIRKLADAVGFGYKWVKEEQQYAHSAAIYVLTPDAKISRYLYGIEYKPKDLKLALLEATEGKIGTVVDRFMLFCYRFDPKTRKYSLYATQLMKLSGAGTVVVFGGYLAIFWRRQRRKTLGEVEAQGKEPNSNV